MIPGAATYIKDAIGTIKRIHDSMRRANALKAIDILLTHDVQTDKSKYFDDVRNILDSEYRSDKQSPPKRTIL